MSHQMPLMPHGHGTLVALDTCSPSVFVGGGGGGLNIQTPSYKYRDSYKKIGRCDDRLIILMEIPIPGKMIFRAGAAIKHDVGCTRRLEDACECDKVFRARLREIIPANNTMQEQNNCTGGIGASWMSRARDMIVSATNGQKIKLWCR